MNKKQTIRLNESQLNRIVSESVKRMLKENFDDKEDMIDFIRQTVKDCGQVRLGKSCGKYVNLMYDYDTDGVLVQTIDGRFADIESLDPNMIWVIYDDVYEDFGE